MCCNMCLTKSTILLVWLDQTSTLSSWKMICLEGCHRRMFSILRWLRKMSFEVSLWTSKDISSFEVCLDPSRSFEWLSGRQIILRSECLSFVHGNLFWVYISMKGFTFTVSSKKFLSKVCVLHRELLCVKPRSLLECIFSLVKVCNRVHWNTRENFDTCLSTLSLVHFAYI